MASLNDSILSPHSGVILYTFRLDRYLDLILIFKEWETGRENGSKQQLLYLCILIIWVSVSSPFSFQYPN